MATLVQTCLKKIDDDFDRIQFPLESSGVILELILAHLMAERKWGSRAMTSHNVLKLILPNISQLDLEGFWLNESEMLSSKPQPGQLFHCPHLQHVNLNGCSAVGEFVLEALQECSALEALSMLRCSRITPKGFHEFTQYPHHELYTLQLDCNRLKTLEDVAKLTSLTSLTLEHMQGIPEDELILLAALESLSELSLADFMGSFQPLSNLISAHPHSWQSLSLIHWRHLKTVEATQWSHCPELTTLMLKRCPVKHLVGFEQLFTETAVEHILCIACEELRDISPLIASEPRLLTLNVDLSKRVNVSSLLAVITSHNTTLETLIVSGLNDKQPLLLPALPSIQRLCLSSRADQAPQFASFSPSLESTSMTLTHTCVSGADVKLLAQLWPNMTQLEVLESHALKFADLPYLASFQQLTALNLSKSTYVGRQFALVSATLLELKVADIVFKVPPVIQCPELHTLDVSNSTFAFGLEWLLQVAPTVQNLWLDNVNVGTHEGIQEILACRALMILNVSQATWLTQAHITELLTCSQLPNLRRIYFNKANGIQESVLAPVLQARKGKHRVVFTNNLMDR